MGTVTGWEPGARSPAHAGFLFGASHLFLSYVILCAQGEGNLSRMSRTGTSGGKEVSSPRPRARALALRPLSESSRSRCSPRGHSRPPRLPNSGPCLCSDRQGPGWGGHLPPPLACPSSPSRATHGPSGPVWVRLFPGSPAWSPGQAVCVPSWGREARAGLGGLGSCAPAVPCGPCGSPSSPSGQPPPPFSGGRGPA